MRPIQLDALRSPHSPAKQVSLRDATLLLMGMPRLETDCATFSDITEGDLTTNRNTQVSSVIYFPSVSQGYSHIRRSVSSIWNSCCHKPENKRLSNQNCLSQFGKSSIRWPKITEFLAQIVFYACLVNFLIPLSGIGDNQNTLQRTGTSSNFDWNLTSVESQGVPGDKQHLEGDEMSWFDSVVTNPLRIEIGNIEEPIFIDSLKFTHSRRKDSCVFPKSNKRCKKKPESKHETKASLVGKVSMKRMKTQRRSENQLKYNAVQGGRLSREQLGQNLFRLKKRNLHEKISSKKPGLRAKLLFHHSREDSQLTVSAHAMNISEKSRLEKM